MTRREGVAITGYGMVTPFGIGVGRTWDGVLAGGAPVTTLDAPDYDACGVRFACAVDAAVVADRFSVSQVRQLDRGTRLGLVAAEDAATMAGISGVDPSRVGVVVGVAYGGIETLYNQASRFGTGGQLAISPFTVPMAMPNALAAHLSIRHGWSGPSRTVVAACASGAEAIATAVDAIRAGGADVLLAGGAEAAVTPWVLAGFDRAGALARAGEGEDAGRICRPFDRDRCGFVLGEGAAFLVLESMEHALARGAEIIGEVAGIGRASEAHHVVAPEQEGTGTAAAMERALADAGIGAGEVSSVNAHGTATRRNDLAEARGLARVFAGCDPVVTSVKSTLGHSLGAAGAIEAVLAVETARRNVVPPTHNTTDVDEEITIRVATGEPVAAGDGYVMSNSFAFGGHNVSLLLGAGT